MDTSEKILERLAFTTWGTISNAFFERISYGEDAITSVNLLTLKNQSLTNLALQDTRIDESRKGCDFEFWIGSNKRGWNRYAIQAKKITVSDDRYNSLSHSVGGKSQIDILEKYSAANRAIPLYCLFNYSQRISHVSSKCSKYASIQELGCSITPSKTVREALSTRGARTFQWFHNRKETLPWSCLVRCQNISHHWSPSVLGHDLKEMMYEKLPAQLNLLLKHASQIEALAESGLFSRDFDHWPRWLGVLEIADE